jgi:hypothetical protein
VTVAPNFRQSVLDIRDAGIICDGVKRGQSAEIARVFELARKHRLRLTGGGALYLEQTLPASGVECDFDLMPIVTVPFDLLSLNKATKPHARPAWFAPGKPGIITEAVSGKGGKPYVLGVVVDAGRGPAGGDLYRLTQRFVVHGDGDAAFGYMPTTMRVRVLNDKSPGTQVVVGGGYGFAGIGIVGDTESGRFRTDAVGDAVAAWVASDARGSPDGISLDINERGCMASYWESNNFEGSPTVRISNQSRATPKEADWARYLVRTGKVTHLEMVNTRGGSGLGLFAGKDDGSPIDTLRWDADYKEGGSGTLCDIHARVLRGRVEIARWKGECGARVRADDRARFSGAVDGRSAL